MPKLTAVLATCDFFWGLVTVRLKAANFWIMIALRQILHRPKVRPVSQICLAAIACWLLQAEPTNGQELPSGKSAYLKPLDEQQRDLGRIDDALKAASSKLNVQQTFIEEDSLEKVELKPNTYLQLNQARARIESKSNGVLLQFKNVQNVARIKEAEVCNWQPARNREIAAFPLNFLSRS